MATNALPNHTLPANCIVAKSCLILPIVTKAASFTGCNDGAGNWVSAGKWTGVDNYSSADLFCTVTAASGTSETMTVYIQKLSADGVTWQDIAATAQFGTSAANSNFTLISSSQAPFVPTDATLTASSLKLASMGSTWRIKAVIAGTNPSYTLAVWGDFYA